ncbi:MAG: hypothetical protein V1908_05010 [Candidatus Peregrinibacteria bacterium]
MRWIAQILKKKPFIKSVIVFFLAAFAWIPLSHGDQEDPNSLLTKYTADAKKWLDAGGTIRGEQMEGIVPTNKERLKLDEELQAMEEGIRQTSRKMTSMGFENNSQKIMNLWKNAEGTSLDKDGTGPTDDLSALKRIPLGQFINDKGDELTVDKGLEAASTDPPVAVFKEKTTTSLPYRSQELFLKISFSSSPSKNKEIKELEATTYGIASSLLPDQLLKRFDSQAVVGYLLGKAGLQRLGPRVTVRPLVAQDEFYIKYANIDCHPTDEVLFWSDPVVTDGYHPLFGTALNKTVLNGYKQIDMDNITSRGYSQAIEKWNRLQPPEKRVANPFKGYSAKVTPGLVEMSRQGRLSPGVPTDTQLSEALKLSKTLKILPSQKLAKKVSFSPLQYACRGEKQTAPQMIFISDERATDAGLVELDDHQKEVHQTTMAYDTARLQQIAKLVDENKRSRQYVEKAIQLYAQYQEALASIAGGMNADSAIPQITQVRQQVFESLGNCRKILSSLNHQQNNLEQQQWKILLHVLETKRISCTKLMENASCTLNSFRTKNSFK